MKPPHELFRAEALRHHAERPERGDVLRLPPSWTRGAYWLLIAVGAAAALFVVFGRVRRYAEGPAVVRVEGKRCVAVGFLPAREHARLAPGMRARLEPS
ncbi:MAG TPA: hypothetical protein VJS92_07360, partial [Candidatus Polarisedimenticolaceae bacterium]|nr:hypothetical protein [Candidatus Polarisedimenticolaceae bacterium]